MKKKRSKPKRRLKFKMPSGFKLISAIAFLIAGILYTGNLFAQNSILKMEMKEYQEKEELTPTTFPTETVEPESELLKVTKKNYKQVTPTLTTIFYTPPPTPLPTQVSRTDNGQVKQQIINDIAQYNAQRQELINQEAQYCNDETEKAKQTYDPQIQALEQQINELKEQKSIVCPYGEFSEACMVGRISTQLDQLDGQIRIILGQINNLQTDRNNIMSLACGGTISFPDVYTYIQPHVSTYYKIQSQGSGYVMYDLSGSVYLKIQPDGSGGYIVY